MSTSSLSERYWAHDAPLPANSRAELHARSRPQTRMPHRCHFHLQLTACRWERASPAPGPPGRLGASRGRSRPAEVRTCRLAARRGFIVVRVGDERGEGRRE
ncbi:hypothetical protein AcW1_003035 [Taiwanofungus camphoratus]|nr:hypothetical protein AcV5_001781 [Antrodia cinnamomea]KAI0925264.1 hypothetical protein AcV7_005547 [Antrodia cinnamomea]KAI0942391.1 hypothetical protein AcW1_003035 [Antrodia cinnamomea]